MLFDYTTCRKRFGSAYQIEKAISSKRLFKMDTGVYSDTGEESELEVILAKYPSSIVTLESAYMYYGMTDYIPERYSIITGNHAHAINDRRIKQYYIPEAVLNIGKTHIDYDGTNIRIYDRERLLIETARMKNKMPSDQYKEIVNFYRSIRDEIDSSKLPEYLEQFPHRERIMSIIDQEIL